MLDKEGSRGMAGKKVSLYSLILHSATIGLAALVLVLSNENRLLKRQGGDRIPEIKEGEYLNLNDLVGVSANAIVDSTKTILAFCFTTTCPFCERNLENWESIRKQAAVGSNFGIVGVCLDGFSRCRDYVAKHDLKFPVFAPRNSAGFRKSNHLSSVPSTVILDSNGVVRQVWMGLLDRNQMKQIISSGMGDAAHSFTKKGG